MKLNITKKTVTLYPDNIKGQMLKAIDSVSFEVRYHLERQVRLQNYYN